MKMKKYEKEHADIVRHLAAAGGDLFMPGCKGDVKNIMTALKKGILSRRQLKENTTRVYHLAKKLTEAKNG